LFKNIHVTLEESVLDLEELLFLGWWDSVVRGLEVQLGEVFLALLFDFELLLWLLWWFLDGRGLFLTLCFTGTLLCLLLLSLLLWAGCLSASSLDWNLLILSPFLDEFGLVKTANIMDVVAYSHCE